MQVCLRMIAPVELVCHDGSVGVESKAATKADPIDDRETSGRTGLECT